MKLVIEGKLEWRNDDNGSAKLYVDDVQLIPVLSALNGRMVVIEIRYGNEKG